MNAGNAIMGKGLWKALIISLALALAMASAVVYANPPNDAGEHSHGTDEETTGPEATNDILMVKNKYVPDNVLANGSLDITWTNAEKNKEHTVHIHGTDIMSGLIGPGDVFTVPAGTLAIGEYAVHCTIHKNMDMSLTVS